MPALRRYYRGHNLVAMRDVQAGATRVYHFDHQGTTQCLTDEAGVVTDRFASDAWGVQVRRTGSSINRQWYVANFGYYRQAADEYYLRRRWMASNTGTFLSADPSVTGRDSDRLSTLYHSRARWLLPQYLPEKYAYALNAPTSSVDASGLTAGKPGNGKPGPRECMGCARLIDYADSLTCADVCQMVQNAGGYKKYPGIVGGVFCFSRKKCPCFIGAPGYPSAGIPPLKPGECPGIEDCVTAHETGHEPDVTCDPCKGLQRPSWNKPGDAAPMECPHRRASVQCLSALPPMNPHCSGWAAVLTKTLVDYINTYCVPRGL